MKILIIEDEPKAGKYLLQGLSESGFRTDLVRDGKDGLNLALTNEYDLIVLDLILPGLDGWSILSGLREKGRTTCVIILSACNSVDDRVKGLSLGADDYMVKPFAFSELLARVHTLLRRRRHDVQPMMLRAADLELDLIRRRAIRSGHRIRLTALEFSLLELLIRHCGEILPHSLIASQVWNMNYDSNSNVVEVAIRRLRNKIDTPFEHKLIRTVRGMGYVLDAEDSSQDDHKEQDELSEKNDNHHITQE